ncbi:MAG: hypothetical protein FJY65_04435 [Calditrichaeota bacterium]|nr:hypothetical protein [Calditrichota bacterium]
MDSRYPEFLTRKLARITKSKAQKTLESTQEFYRWLLTFLK